MKDRWLVIVEEIETKQQVKVMGPMSERDAARTVRGVQINLNIDDYTVYQEREEIVNSLNN